MWAFAVIIRAQWLTVHQGFAKITQLASHFRMDVYLTVFALLIGCVTGFINTLAGSGSLLTLPFFIFLGLPATEANATNRVGVLIQTFVGSVVMGKKMPALIRESWLLILPGLLGALTGASVASEMRPKAIEIVIAGVMVLMLVLVASNSQKWLRENDEIPDLRNHVLLIIIFAGIGFYAGFIQAGVGIFLLSALVLLSDFSLRQANVLKNLFIFLFTLPAMIIFAAKGQVHWELGLLVASGQGLGAWVAARFAVDSRRASVITRWLLIVMITVSAGKMIVGFFL